MVLFVRSNLTNRIGLPSSLFCRSVKTGPIFLQLPHQSPWNFTAISLGVDVSACVTPVKLKVMRMSSAMMPRYVIGISPVCVVFTG